MGFGEALNKVRSDGDYRWSKFDALDSEVGTVCPQRHVMHRFRKINGCVILPKILGS